MRKISGIAKRLSAMQEDDEILSDLSPRGSIKKKGEGYRFYTNAVSDSFFTFLHFR